EIYEIFGGISIGYSEDTQTLTGNKIHHNTLHNTFYTYTSNGLNETGSEFHDNTATSFMTFLRIQDVDKSGPGRSVYAYNNRLYNPVRYGEEGIYWHAHTSDGSADIVGQFWIYHNTIVNGNVGIATGVGGGARGTGIHIVNNLIENAYIVGSDAGL